MQEFISICYETQGRSHVGSKTPCQDRAYSLIDSDIGIITLCDGAGSARLSHYGAERTSRVVANLMRDNFGRYYTESESSVVAKEILESINNELIKESETRINELKDGAYKEIQRLLEKGLNDLNGVRCNIDFTYKAELERKIASLDTDIRELHNRKDKSRREHDSYRKDLQTDIEEYWQEYKERINNLRIFYIKILKKQHRKFLKKLFNLVKSLFKEDELSGIKDIESCSKYIQNSTSQENRILKGLLSKIESSMNDIKADKQEKIANIIKDLEKIGQDILKTLKQVYKDINKHAKELQEKSKKQKDELEIQHGELHNHILKTKKYQELSNMN